MNPARRTLLKILGLTGATLPLMGCERLISNVTQQMGQAIPSSLSLADGLQIDPAFHLLSRAAYGPWPGDLDRVRTMGVDKWIEEQLAPDGIDDTACNLRARRFETIWHEPGTCYEYKKPVLREEITRHTLLRAVYSRRQLFEVMVGFWTDHLNIDLEKGDCIYLKPSDDRLVIRAHALGRFRDLIRASATSPAILVYLDGKENKKGNPSDVPNENYARELLELHTLGVDGGYSQLDVFEAARCLTGWRLRTGWRKGTVYFDPSLHDDGEKHVLGQLIPAGGGAADLDRLVDIACHHPSTARHIATKLVRRFVSEDVTESLVTRVAEVFTATDGDIKSQLRTILASEEFNAAKGLKFKRPFQYIVTSLRALGADTHAHQPLIEYLQRMGQGPFQHPTPDGYPDRAAPWLGTLLWRWNFAFALASGRVPTVSVALDQLGEAIGAIGAIEANAGNANNGLQPARLIPYFFGRAGSATELSALDDYLQAQLDSDLGDANHRAELFALVLASPAFQRC
ncbi:MAG: DUF1800 domain-containing protein [Pyrinomonadaceae bacterium]|nr:DUF1800 domain-containing protein [Pyrinomonadaceae bacterium]